MIFFKLVDALSDRLISVFIAGIARADKIIFFEKFLRSIFVILISYIFISQL